MIRRSFSLLRQATSSRSSSVGASSAIAISRMMSTLRNSNNSYSNGRISGNPSSSSNNNSNIAGGEKKKQFTILFTNVNPDTQWFHLKDLLKPFNVSHVQKLLSSQNGYLVKFQSAQDAQSAIAAHDGAEFMGSKLNVAKGSGNRQFDNSSSNDSNSSESNSGSSNPNPQVLNTSSVYIGNLAFETTEDTLREHLAQAGRVVKVHILKSMGSSKGCALAEFADKDSANRAISELQNTRVDGRLLFLREDRDAERLTSRQRNSSPYFDREGGSSNSSNSSNRSSNNRNSNDEDAPKTIYITGLPYEMDWTHLKKYCGDNIGFVEYSQIFTDRQSGMSKGCGIVRFQREEDADAAVEKLNNTYLENRFVAVRKWRVDNGKGGDSDSISN